VTFRGAVTVQAQGGRGGCGADGDQRGEQAGAPAGAERRPAAGGAEQEAGGEGQGAQPAAAAGRAGAS
jgi:hypothetical protein